MSESEHGNKIILESTLSKDSQDLEQNKSSSLSSSSKRKSVRTSTLPSSSDVALRVANKSTGQQKAGQSKEETHKQDSSRKGI